MRPPLQQPHRLRRRQGLGRQIEQIQVPADERGLDRPPAVEVERRVDEPGPHAQRGQRVDLVLHQRDQR
jgi:hypothetical protein